MKRRGPFWLILVVILVSLACNAPTAPGVGVPVTGSPQALTATALFNTPQQNSTQQPGVITQTPGAAQVTNAPDCTYRAEFVSDVTVPDDTVVARGEQFVKTWRVRNAGTCAWGPGLALNAIQFTEGDQLGAPERVPLTGTIAPGQEADISVSMVAPNDPGTYISQWKFALENGPEDLGGSLGIGENQDDPLYAQIKVE